MTGTQVTDRTLDVLEAIARLGSASLPDIQQRCGLSTTTAHRIMQALVRRGFIIRTRRGGYRIGTAALALGEGTSVRHLLETVARSHVAILSRKTRSHAHLGILEDGMVTYLIKQRYGKTRLHSAEGMQLEAYCSALGKVLLGGLTEPELDRYLSEGDFVSLTEKTITHAAALSQEIRNARTRGWACDEEEIAPGLWCLAVPITDERGAVFAALSASLFSKTPPNMLSSHLATLLESAGAIRRALFPACSLAGADGRPLPRNPASDGTS